MMIGTTVISSPHELYHSKCVNKLGQVMTSINTIMHFLRNIGEKCSFKKTSNHPHESENLPEATENEVMESITTNKNYSATQEPINNVTNEDDLMKLFDQFCNLMIPTSDSPQLDTTTVVSEALLQGKGATYQVTIHNLATTALQDTGANMSVVSEKFFKSLPQTQNYQRYTHIKSCQLVELI